MEVMAGLALLATVLVALLQIEARSRRQTAHAERHAQAVKVADALLTEWWQLPQGLPRAGGGVVQSDPSLTWRTTTIDDATVNELSGQMIEQQRMALPARFATRLRRRDWEQKRPLLGRW